MSRLGLKTFVQHFTDRDSLEAIVRDGMTSLIIPSEEIRKVYEWVLDYFYNSSRTAAPSITLLRKEFGDLLDDQEIELTDPEDTIEWAIDDLKGSFVYSQTAGFNKRLASAMSEAGTLERVEVLSEHATELITLSMAMENHETRIDAREGFSERLSAYEARAADDTIRGMTFGLEQIDDYTRGIQPGELAILAAGPKTGKSYFLDLVALKEWQRGKAVVLFTLENSVEMTLDRMACLAMGVNSTAWQHGECDEYEIERVRMWIEQVKESNVPLWVLQPEMGKRTPEALIREAQIRDADCVLIDQLSHIENDMSDRVAKTYQIERTTQTIKNMISSGRDRIPCLLAHQISREGVKSAEKLGYLEMYHLADSASVERTADWVFSVYRSKDETVAAQAKFQTLAARRMAAKNYQLRWNVEAGMVGVKREIEIGS